MVSFLKVYQTLVAKKELSADPDQLAAVLHLQTLAEGLQQNRGRFFSWAMTAPTPASLYLWGGVGRGKSMLMDLFFDVIKIKKKRRVHFMEFMQETHRTLKTLRQTESRDALISLAEQMAAETDLLCLDEFQVSDIADASILGRLFSALFEAGLILVATSNRKPDDLYLDGLNRDRLLPFIALLKERAEIVPLGTGRDYRRAMMAGTERYYINDSRSLYQSFTRITHGINSKCQLDVGGRRLPIRKQGMGCAYFHFDDLCVKPLGTADYLALAHAYHTILVDHIPVLTPEKRNEVLRFIHLIDALYDNRVLLIANAAANLEALYPKGKSQFEFERTLSRLREMQSPDYMPHQNR